jgi:GNAT superfamily N-acetyltransferase
MDVSDDSLAEVRRKAALRWLALDGAWDRRLPGATAPSHPVASLALGWRAQSGRRRTEKLRLELRTAASTLERLGAGAEGEWGLFSVTPGTGAPNSIERTLRTLAAADHHPPLASAAREALDLVPQARSRAEVRGDRSALADLEDSVVAMVDLSRHLPNLAGVLKEHLPGARRPVASSIEELDDAPRERVTRCRLSVTEGLAGSYADAIRELDGLSHVICLHRIDTVSSAQGFGLGTAALVELCAYAERRGLPIVATLAPSDRAPETLRRVARWYARVGFRRAKGGADAWERCDVIWRPAAGMPQE